MCDVAASHSEGCVNVTMGTNHVSEVVSRVVATHEEEVTRTRSKTRFMRKVLELSR